MNCLKSVHIIREYGTIRLTILAIFLMVTFFTLFYVGFGNLYPNLSLGAINPLLLIAALGLAYPMHKLFHGLPVWMSGYHCRLSIQWKPGYPLLFCDLRSRLPRNLALCVVVFPGTLLTLAAMMTAALEPQWLPYMAVAAAVNFGLSVTDWIYAALLLKTPPHAYIEDFHDGFHVLIRRTSENKRAQ